MKNQITIIKLLVLLLSVICGSTKDVLVSLNNSSGYTSLDQAIEALLSGQYLVDSTNTVTVDSSCLSTTLVFPNTQIYGTTTGDGSIAITYSGFTGSVSAEI